MAKYHYNVNIIPAKQDFSIWVGVIVANKYDGAEGEFVHEDTELWDAAIARARELCPSLKECFCEEWNGGDEVIDPVRKFLGDDYEDKMRGIVALFEPFMAAMHKANMVLAVDTRGDYCLTAIPNKPWNGLDTTKILEGTIPLSDHDLVTLLD